jgi:hypothetical protein
MTWMSTPARVIKVWHVVQRAMNIRTGVYSQPQSIVTTLAFAFLSRWPGPERSESEQTLLTRCTSWSFSADSSFYHFCNTSMKLEWLKVCIVGFFNSLTRRICDGSM